MDVGPTPAGRGIVPGQIAEIIVALDGQPGRRGSGYRVGPGAVLTAAHVIDGAASVRVRFDADLPGEWTAEVISCWTDPRSDLAVLTIAPREGEPAVAVPRFGRIGDDRAAVLAVQGVGFPRFKLKSDDGVDDHPQRYRDSHQADGSMAVLSNRREGTLEITVPPPERDPDPELSPWEGMSGAAVWIGDRIVGVIAKHHRSDGLGRLAAARLELALEGLDPEQSAELRTLLSLPDVLPDVVPPSAGERVRTAYQAQVRDIAPDRLLDRAAELDELVAFCAGDQPYAWWQAGPWAGKSALMSWFVLHPPAGVDVVSFFVTARLAGQSDSDACTDALIEQLAALVGESPAGLLRAGARRGTMLQLLDDAAGRAREAGRRLLLVIDGLDEDSGTATGLSIAALLPRRLPSGVKVLLASRPHPPIPDDVAEEHPLRTTSPSQIDVSEHARDVERRAKRELAQLLAGEQLQRDVLGLITAAGGGLTLDDMEELTGRPPYEIEPMLGGLFGRSIGSRTRPPAVGHADERLYLFTHETLRLVAERQYGNSLATYRDRLHGWADTYRQQGWPTYTPQYLLRSYPRLLASGGDLTRLVACAIDQVRHDRMRDLTGGDALAFNEISTAQQFILDQPDPDLTSLSLLAVQRDHLTGRNRKIPIDLPAVWERIGNPIRAEALAHSVPEYSRAGALARLAEAATARGDHDRAEVLGGQITDPDTRGRALASLVEMAAARGDRDRVIRLVDEAEALTEQITDPHRRQSALACLMKVVAAAGDHDRAARLVDEAEVLTDQITDPNQRGWALAWLVEVVAAGGDHDRAARLVDEAEALIDQIIAPGQERWALDRVMETVAAVGGHDRAVALTRQITGLCERAKVLARLVEVVAADGDHDRAARLADEAEALTSEITHPGERMVALDRLADAVGAGGDHDRAVALTTQITNPDSQDWALVSLARVIMATGGDHDRAEALITHVIDPRPRAQALASFAEAVSAGGDHDRALALTNQIADPNARAHALARIAEAVAAGGDHDRAARLADEAEALTRHISDPNRPAWELQQLAEAVGASGDHDRAEVLTRQLHNQVPGADVLARLAEMATAGGDHDRAARLADEAEVLTRQITDPGDRAWMLARLVEVVTTSGDHDRAARLADEAEVLTRQITDPDLRASVLARLVEVVTTSGDHDRAARLADEAEALAEQITDPDYRGAVLARLVEGVSAGGDHDRAARLADEAEGLARRFTDPDFRVWVLARLVERVSAGGDHDRAARLADEAEALTRQSTDRFQLALRRLAEAVVGGVDHNRAEALIRQIPDGPGPNLQVKLHAKAKLLARLVEVVAAGGDHDRAARLADETEALTRQITNPEDRAEALAGFARMLVEIGEESSPVPQRAHSSSPLMVRARHLLAQALVAGSWTRVIPSLGRVDPLAINALADVWQARWGLNARAGTETPDRFEQLQGLVTDQKRVTLRRFEERLQGLFRDSYYTIFDGVVDPVAIASAMQQEAIEHVIIHDNGYTVVPNRYVIDLVPADHDRLAPYCGLLAQELAQMQAEFIGEHDWMVYGDIVTEIGRGSGLEIGLFRVDAEIDPTAEKDTEIEQKPENTTSLRAVMHFSEDQVKGHDKLLNNQTRIPGPDAFDTLLTRYDQAVLLGAQGQVRESTERLRKLLVDQVRLVGPRHSDVIKTTATLISLLRQHKGIYAARNFLDGLIADWKNRFVTDSIGLEGVYKQLCELDKD